jgi:redox-sensing transcriptional repressor
MAKTRPDIPPIVVERLCLYRRLLRELRSDGVTQVFSHKLARLAGFSPGLVRRDLMVTGHTGSTNRGYTVIDLIEELNQVLSGNHKQQVALIGVGDLGRALLKFFHGLWPNLTIQAAFDVDPAKVDRVICGTRVHSMDQLEAVIAKEQIRIAILVVPDEAAQEVTDQLVHIGVTSLLNMTHARLRVPIDTYTEDLDVSIALEKVAFFGQ